MCVIIHVGAKKSVAWKQLENSYRANSHGWGIMWAKDGKLHSVKNIGPFQDFANIWRDIPRDVERAIHFRIRTHGDTNKANCHPFPVSDTIGLMHNGIIDTNLIETNMSDTFNFTEYELKPIMAGWPGCLEDPTFKKLLEDVTGFSKLLLMDNTGKVIKIRENLWTERNGIFFSNAGSVSYNYSSAHDADDQWWKSDRRGYGHNNNYRGRDTYKAIADQSKAATKQHSDLYASNKTDEEGLAYLEEKEKERLEAQKDIDAVMGGNQQVSDSAAQDDDTEDDDTVFTLDFEQLLAMSDADKLDWVQDNPKSAVYVVNGLLDTLAQAGIVDIDYKTSVTISNQQSKSAVNG